MIPIVTVVLCPATRVDAQIMTNHSEANVLTGTGDAPAYPAFARETVAHEAAELRRLVEQYAASVAGEERVAGGSLHDGLNRAAWQLAETIAWARICECPDLDIPIAELLGLEERLFLDLGFVGEELCGQSRAELTEAIDDREGMGGDELRVELLHHYVENVAATFFRSGEKRSLRKAIAAKEDELRAGRAEAKQARAEHLRLLDVMANRGRLIQLQGDLDEIVQALAAVKSIGRGHHTPETRRQEQKLMEAWNRLRNCQNELIDTYLERKAVADSHNHCLGMATAVKKLESQITDLRDQLTVVVREARGIPHDRLRDRVRGSVEAIRQILRRANRLEAGSCPQFCLENRAVWLPGRVLNRIGEILTTDERLAQAWGNGSWPTPRLVVLPGTGSAVYEQERETVFIPLAGQLQGQCPVTRAIGLHRFHNAGHEQTSFGSLGAYRKVRGAQDLAAVFAVGYDTYINRETKGFRKLPAEVHRWFKLNLRQ